MTLYRTLEVRCANCQTPSARSLLMSTHARGSPDLDDRPSVPARFTMDAWLQQCPSCGYVAARLDDANDEGRHFVASADYQSLLLETQSRPAAARRFYLRALLDHLAGNRERAFCNKLAAAWLADDQHDDARAKQMRIEASEHLTGCRNLALTTRIQMIDVYRRSSGWTEARAVISSVNDEQLSDRLRSIIKFQTERVLGQDTKRYTVEDALKAYPIRL